MFHRRRAVETLGESWSTVLMQHEAGPLVIRVNDALRRAAGDPGWPWRLSVRAEVGEGADLPGPEDGPGLDAIEARIRDRIADGRAVLALIISGTGAHNWVMHSRSDDWFRPFVRELAEETTSHRILAAIDNDPGWETYRDLSGR